VQQGRAHDSTFSDKPDRQGFKNTLLVAIVNQLIYLCNQVPTLFKEELVYFILEVGIKAPDFEVSLQKITVS
jgi:hypothetical protein